MRGRDSDRSNLQVPCETGEGLLPNVRNHRDIARNRRRRGNLPAPGGGAAGRGRLLRFARNVLGVRNPRRPLLAGHCEKPQATRRSPLSCCHCEKRSRRDDAFYRADIARARQRPKQSPGNLAALSLERMSKNGESSFPSFLRRQESSGSRYSGIPAFAGMTHIMRFRHSLEGGSR